MIDPHDRMLNALESLQREAAERIEELYDSYWAGAIVNEPETLEEVMQCLAYFIDYRGEPE